MPTCDHCGQEKDQLRTVAAGNLCVYCHAKYVDKLEKEVSEWKKLAEVYDIELTDVKNHLAFLKKERNRLQGALNELKQEMKEINKEITRIQDD